MRSVATTAGGLRALWSEIDALVAGDRVGAINATVVPLRQRRLAGSPGTRAVVQRG